MRLALAGLAACALASCASTPQPRDRYERLLTPTAKPSKVIATELAFARAAQEDGQWTAFREYAAPGALLFGQNGAIEAAPWLREQEDPPAAVAWEPYRVWSSCDGSLAVTQGGFREPEGQVGTFNTVWQRQRDGDYEYVFDFGVPQATAPEKPDAISAATADCNPPAESAAELPADARFSSDRTLAWRFELTGQGTRTYEVWLAGPGGYEQVVDIDVPPTAR